MGANSEDDRLSYRKRSVDGELVDHDNRITRLERLALIAGGYVLADQEMLFDAVAGFVF